MATARSYLSPALLYLVYPLRRQAGEGAIQRFESGLAENKSGSNENGRRVRVRLKPKPRLKIGIMTLSASVCLAAFKLAMSPLFVR